MGSEQQPGPIQAQRGFSQEAEAVLSPGEWALPLEHHATLENPGVAEQKLFPRQKVVCLVQEHLPA